MFNKLAPFLVIIILVTALFSGSCGGNNDKPDMNLTTAIEIVSSSSTGLTVKSILNSREVRLDKDSPNFGTVFKYVENAVQNRAQPRFSDFRGTTAEIAIPYVLNYKLIFRSSTGADIEFDYGYDTIWFTSKDMIYGAAVDTNLDGVLQQIFK